MTHRLRRDLGLETRAVAMEQLSRYASGEDGPVRINQRPAAEVETRATRTNFHRPTLSQKTAKGLGTLGNECPILRPKGCATRPDVRRTMSMGSADFYFAACCEM
jgi:hypothetical protein